MIRSRYFILWCALCKVWTIRSLSFRSNVCYAADTYESDLNSSEHHPDVREENDIQPQPPAARSKSSSRSSDPKRYNNTILNELFHVQTCPTRCVALQQQQYHTAKRTAASTTTIRNGSHSRAAVTPTANPPLRIFYLILIHNIRTANDALYLFRAIRDPHNIIVIHFDKKVEHLLSHHHHHTTSDSLLENLLNDSEPVDPPPLLSLLQEIESCSCGSTVRMESVYSVEWSKWSMNLPTLWGMEVATSPEFVHQWDVFINLSGDTIPVYTVDTMAQMLQNLTYNFVTSRSCETGLLPTNVYTFPKFWHKRRHYTNDETGRDPVFTFTATSPAATMAEPETNTRATTARTNDDEFIHVTRHKTIQTHFGSQWVIVQHTFVVWLMEQLKDEMSWPSQFRTYLQTSNLLMTDETFIPTVLMHINLEEDGIHPMLPQIHPVHNLLLWNNGTSSLISDVRFERMDEHFPSASGAFPETQRYQVPASLLQQNILDQPKVWGPYFLGTYDLGHIRDSGALFARKVSALLDYNMVQLLPVHQLNEIPNIHWPVDVSVTNRPDWHIEKQLWEELHGTKPKLSTDTSVNDDDNEDEL
jgi:hypothetical protein